MEDSDFAKLILPKYDKTPCSPKLADDFIGILINAPKQIVLGGGVQIPVCGGYALPMSFKHKLVESVVLVVVDKNDNTPRSFNLVPDKEPAVSAEHDAIDSDGDAGEEFNISGEIEVYFNIDILNFLPGLPLKKTTYFAYAVLGPYKSNTVEIELVAK